MAEKALVTGAAGFIGSHLSERLVERGWKVVGVDAMTDTYGRHVKQANLRHLAQSDRFRFVEADLNETDLAALLDGVDVVFHQAARAGVRTSWGLEFESYLNENVMATQRLLEAIRERPVRRFVFASSSSLYGDTKDLPVSESTPKRPNSPYGVTKLAAENLGHLYRRNHGIPFVALRYFTVFGPRQRPDMLFYRIFESVYDERTLRIYGDGGQTRDFTFVGDAAEANLLAAERETEKSVFNVGGGARASVADVIAAVEEMTGRKVRAERADTQKGDVRDTWSDSSSAARELGFAPSTDLRTGLAAMDRWFRNRADAEA